MTRRRNIFITLTAVALMSALLIAALSNGDDGQPMVHGKPLEQWCKSGSAEYSERLRAVQEIGTNALPWLLDWMESQDSADDLERRKFNAMQPVIQLPAHSAMEMKLKAVNGFYLLGSAAAPAIPELLRRMQRRDADFGLHAHCLAAIGNQGLEALRPVFNDSNTREQCEILQAVDTACDRWERGLSSLDEFSGVHWLVGALTNGRSEVIERGLRYLSNRDQLTPAILEACRPFLDSEHQQVKKQAGRLFAIHGPSAATSD